MRKTILAAALAALAATFASPAAAQCPLTAPKVVSWTCDDYYPSRQWSCFGVTVQDNVPMVDPNGSFAQVASDLWYVSTREDGSVVTIPLVPRTSGSLSILKFSQVELSDGCYQASYTMEGVPDGPLNSPSACEKNPLDPPACADRINAEFPAESTGWQVDHDSLGRKGPLVIGAPCLTQGTPGTSNTPGANRGAACANK